MQQEVPDPEESESAHANPPGKEPPLTKPAAIGNEYATHDEETIARSLHDASKFAQGPQATTWEKVDPIYRQRRLYAAHDLVTLGYVQKTNRYFGDEEV